MEDLIEVDSRVSTYQRRSSGEGEDRMMGRRNNRGRGSEGMEFRRREGEKCYLGSVQTDSGGR